MSIDFFGFLFGVLGALLLALNRPKVSRWGFVLFLASNVSWILWALDNGHRWILLQTLVFSVTSMLGVWQWFSRARAPRAEALVDVTSSVFMPRLCGGTDRSPIGRAV